MGGSFIYYRPMQVRLAKRNRTIEMPLSRSFRVSAASVRGEKWGRYNGIIDLRERPITPYG